MKGIKSGMCGGRMDEGASHIMPKSTCVTMTPFAILDFGLGDYNLIHSPSLITNEAWESHPVVKVLDS